MTSSSTRLNRGGDRALHTVAITRMRCHPETRAYQASRTSEGKTHRDIRRSLQCSLARCPDRQIEAAGRLDGARAAAGQNIGASNGLLRQHVPKDTDLSLHSPERLLEVAAGLHDRPRKDPRRHHSRASDAAPTVCPRTTHRCDDHLNSPIPSGAPGTTLSHLRPGAPDSCRVELSGVVALGARCARRRWGRWIESVECVLAGWDQRVARIVARTRGWPSISGRSMISTSPRPTMRPSRRRPSAGKPQ